MPGLSSPQSSAGILSFYDAQTPGPKFNPKIVLAIVVIFVLIVLIVNHIIYA